MALATTGSLSEAERRVVESFIEALRARFGDGLRSVWLYGSRARNEPRQPDSDVDLLIVSEGGSKHDGPVVNKIIWDAAWSKDMNPYAFSIVVWDPQWLRRRREIRSFFVQEVDRDKVVLFGEE